MWLKSSSHSTVVAKDTSPSRLGEPCGTGAGWQSGLCSRSPNPLGVLLGLRLDSRPGGGKALAFPEALLLQKLSPSLPFSLRGASLICFISHCSCSWLPGLGFAVLL